ncbi:Beige/BEACH domain [Carpediemonas membranifera]|uniref:Beige/BEACH domain n=1 Tax=Carpediemonas membranifera TaxID=201153 RepID=A0A8J6EB94_9EUKA|nr:Beige/BEACH domain [Carpediemonas membranifera]|eukprot:KAG9396610.1 Beige/BEACH domain [Carpediemonas membranifera]
MGRDKFNLLQLAEDENFLESYYVAYTMEDSDMQTGRIVLGTASLSFVPAAIDAPLYRIALTDMNGIEDVDRAIGKHRVTAKVHTVISNPRQPFNTVKTPVIINFKMDTTDATRLIETVARLLDIAAQDWSVRADLIKQFLTDEVARTPFDTTVLRAGESIIEEHAATYVIALLRISGRIVVTNKALYFQAAHAVTGNDVVRWSLRNIVGQLRQRYAMRHVGLEVFLSGPQGSYNVVDLDPVFDFASCKSIAFLFGAKSVTDSVYFAFDTPTARDAVAAMLFQDHGVRGPMPLDALTGRWVQGRISNFEYILALNMLAGRSFRDVAQYPVFPWVLQDYTSTELDLGDPKVYRDLSKPIGALNKDRLDRFRGRMLDLPPAERFLFGTHYSAPGYVLYYLIRAGPEYILRLQRGRFDAPDRLFHSIAETWTSVLTSPTDIKELIPEFYCNPENASSFLTNRRGLNLGQRSTRDYVHDVILPPWADTPADFVSKMRAALESNYTTTHLHLWIDLVFGCLQSGEAAVHANNLFHPNTYESLVTKMTMTPALWQHVMEFGQTPIQLLVDPHPRHVRWSKEDSASGGEDEPTDGKQASRPVARPVNPAHVETIRTATVVSVFWASVAVAKRALPGKLGAAVVPSQLDCGPRFKVGPGPVVSVAPIDDRSVCALGVKCMLVDILDGKHEHTIDLGRLKFVKALGHPLVQDALCLACRDGTLATVSLATGKIVKRVRLHAESVTSLAVGVGRSESSMTMSVLMVSTGTEKTPDQVKLWRVGRGAVDAASTFTVPLGPVAGPRMGLPTACDVCNDTVVVGCANGMVRTYSLLDRRSGETEAHNDEIVGAAFIHPPEGLLVVTASSDMTLAVCTPAPAKRATVFIGHAITALTRAVGTVVVGDDDGTVWVIADTVLAALDSPGQAVHIETVPHVCFNVGAAITALNSSYDGGRIHVGTAAGEVVSLVARCL